MNTVIAFRATLRRRGMTLVELMVTIAVIGILASMILFAMRGAQESARVAKTQSIITKIHELLMPLYESYRTRRLAVDTTGLSPTDATFQRLRGVRRLMQLEMPERWNEVVRLGPGTEVDAPDFAPLQRQPALSQAYWRRYHRNRDPASGELRTTDQNQGAECLYLIVTLATADGEGRAHFSESDIGDTDGDGAPEFLDGWGRPISFLRWPAGFPSEKQPLFGDGSGALAEATINTGNGEIEQITVTDGGSGYSQDNPPPVAIIGGGGTGGTATAIIDTSGALTTIELLSSCGLHTESPSVIVGRDGYSDHDPFDPQRYDTGAYRLFPLVYSGGPDGVKEILSNNPDRNFEYPTPGPKDSTIPPPNGLLHPYAEVGVLGEIGTPRDLDNDGKEEWHDNIHNHLIGTR